LEKESQCVLINIYAFTLGNNLKAGFFSLSRSHRGDVGTWDLMYSDALKQKPEQNFLRSV